MYRFCCGGDSGDGKTPDPPPTHTHSILHKTFVHRSRCELGGLRVGIKQKQDPALTDICLSC